MANPRMIADDEFFRTIWASEIPVPDIAQIYGTSRAAIYRASDRFDYQPRNMHSLCIAVPSTMPARLDDQIHWSGGSWAVLSQIAERHGLRMTKIQSLYHRAKSDASNFANNRLADTGAASLASAKIYRANCA